MTATQMSRRWLTRVLSIIALCAWSGLVAASGGARNFGDNWSPEDCGIFKLKASSRAATCGYVTVPLRHDVDGSPRIRLAVVIIPASNETPRESVPLFLAQGGPGGSTIGGFAQVLLDDPGKRPVQNRDLVLWDQRGTYFSQPRLICREMNTLPSSADDAQQAEAYRQCGVRLNAEAGDLSAFNSQENARDIDSVREALGYEAFNFYGVSYGTELGQFLLRERPPGLRSVVLDAVVPLGFSLVTDVPAVKQQLMLQYAKSCEESPSCNAAYPSLRSRYLALIDKLDREPIPLTQSAAESDASTVASPDKSPKLTGKTTGSRPVSVGLYARGRFACALHRLSRRTG